MWPDQKGSSALRRSGSAAMGRWRSVLRGRSKWSPGNQIHMMLALPFTRRGFAAGAATRSACKGDRGRGRSRPISRVSSPLEPPRANSGGDRDSKIFTMTCSTEFDSRDLRRVLALPRRHCLPPRKGGRTSAMGGSREFGARFNMDRVSAETDTGAKRPQKLGLD